MSEESTAPESGQAEFKPITSQDDLNRVIADRVSRERAKFADYSDLKAKAEQFEQLEAEKMTEAQKLQAQLNEQTERAAQAERERARLQVIADAAIPAEYHALVHGNTDEELKASAKVARELIDKANTAQQTPGVSYRVNLDGDGSDKLALNGDGIENALKQKLGIA